MRAKVQGILDRKNHKILSIAFEHYKGIVLIGRAQSLFKIKLLLTAFRKWLEYHNYIKCLKGTEMIYNRKLKTKALASFMCFVDIML